MPKTTTITVPTAAIKALNIRGPVSAWPDSGDWTDQDDWIVGIACTGFGDRAGFAVKNGSSPPRHWRPLAERLPATEARALAAILNAARPQPPETKKPTP
jgi:hypothetical protein